MPERKPGEGKPHVSIGTIGHPDHDKATLAEAIDKYLESGSGSGPAGRSGPGRRPGFRKAGKTRRDRKAGP